MAAALTMAAIDGGYVQRLSSKQTEERRVHELLCDE
jgi:hypothetical protein